MITRYLAGGALLLGAFAAIAGSPRLEGNARLDVGGLAAIVESEQDHITAIELAQWIRDQRTDLRLVDVRVSSDFDAYHLPGAERIALDELVSTPFNRNETIVLYSDGGAHAAQGWVFLRALGHERVYFLRGGLHEWLDQVMNPVISPTAPDSTRAAFEVVSEISRYFGGVPRVGNRTTSQSSLGLPDSRGDDGSVQSAESRVRRRGC